jgi:hypothetical protein
MSRIDIVKIFSRIYEEHLWKGSSRSGPGSSLNATEPLREGLRLLFSDLDIRVLSDAACGTAEWITTVTDGLDLYMGFDIVEKIIVEARARNTRRNHSFRVANVIEHIMPVSDAILCRDCLVHLSFEEAQRAIMNFKASGSTYLLATTFPAREQNIPATTGRWRPLNLQLAPFNLPPPFRLLRDRVERPDDRHADKSIGVWRLADL